MFRWQLAFEPCEVNAGCAADHATDCCKLHALWRVTALSIVQETQVVMEGRPTLPPRSGDCSIKQAGLVVEWALCCCPGMLEGWTVSGCGPCDGWPAKTSMTPP